MRRLPLASRWAAIIFLWRFLKRSSTFDWFGMLTWVLTTIGNPDVSRLRSMPG